MSDRYCMFINRSPAAFPDCYSDLCTATSHPSEAAARRPLKFQAPLANWEQQIKEVSKRDE